MLSKFHLLLLLLALLAGVTSEEQGGAEQQPPTGKEPSYEASEPEDPKPSEPAGDASEAEAASEPPAASSEASEPEGAAGASETEATTSESASEPVEVTVPGSKRPKKRRFEMLEVEESEVEAFVGGEQFAAVLYHDHSKVINRDERRLYRAHIIKRHFAFKPHALLKWYGK